MSRFTPLGVVALGLITLVLGNVGRVPSFMLGGRVSPLVLNDLILVPLWLTIAAAVTHGRRALPWSADTVWRRTVLFASIAAVSLVMGVLQWRPSAEGTITGALYWARWVGYAGWYLLMVVCLDGGQVRRVVSWLERALLGLAGFGIVQSLFLPGFAQMVQAGGADRQWDAQGMRLVSTMLDPNFAGILIVIALLLLLARELEGERVPLWHPLLLLLALGLTVSRSTVLALVVGVTVLVLMRGLTLRVARFGASLLVLLVLSAPVWIPLANAFGKLEVAEGSAAARLVPWSRAVLLIRDQPWLGVGFNLSDVAQRAYGWPAAAGADGSLDGGLLYVAVLTGVIGLAAYVALLWAVQRQARRVWSSGASPWDRALATGVWAGVVATVVHSLFVNSLLLSFVLHVQWLMFGALAVIARALPLPSLISARRAVPRLVVPLVLIIGLSACDPCAGEVACTVDDVVLTGTLVEPVTGKPAAGVRVAVGIFETRSDAEGLWTLRWDARGDLPTAVDVVVGDTAADGYVARDIALRAPRRGSDATVVGRWSSVPFAQHIVTIRRAGVPLTGAVAQWVPDDPTAVNAVSTTSTSGTGGFVYFTLLGRHGLGRVLGTMTVTHPALSRPSVLRGVPIELGYRYGLPQPAGDIPVGGQLRYGAQVRFRGNGQNMPGATVVFERTGGIALSEDRVSVTSGADGYFQLQLDPVELGEVVGRLIVSGPLGRRPSVYENVRFSTYDSLDVRSAGVYSYGERWAQVVELWSNTTLRPAAGIRAEFIPRSGLGLGDPVLVGESGADGRVQFTAIVQDTGSVVGDLVLRQAPWADRVFPGLVWRTVESDDLPFTGVFSIGQVMRYRGEFRQLDFSAIPNAEVRWRRTGGVAVTPSEGTFVTDARGDFYWVLTPADSGEVVGEVSITLPPPWPAGTVRTFPFNLRSHSDANLRLGFFRVIPPP